MPRKLPLALKLWIQAVREAGGARPGKFVAVRRGTPMYTKAKSKYEELRRRHGLGPGGSSSSSSRRKSRKRSTRKRTRKSSTRKRRSAPRRYRAYDYDDE